MLTLNADSACDVCAEEYGPFNLPQCIPCGHVLCASCAEAIIKKAPQRVAPCPFCREGYTHDGIRVIRTDFSGSSGGGSSRGMNGMGGYGRVGGDGFGDAETCIDGGAYNSGAMDDETVLYDVRQSRSPTHSTRPSRDPSRAASPERGHPSQNGIFTTINEDHHGLPSKLDLNAHKDRARDLEKKVAKVATKRCSAEEVQALQRELGEWLATDKVLGSNALSSSDKQQHAAIHLSHLLLRAILMNHLAHSEASRVAKGAEVQLRARIVDGELVREKLDEDLRKTKNLLQSKTHEVTVLRAELARHKGEEGGEHGHGYSHAQGAITPTRRQSLSAPTSPDSYFPSFAYSTTGFSSASTAVPPTSASRSNPSSGANSPSSSGRTTPTAGLALHSATANMMPMGSTFPPIAMTLSMSGAMGTMNNGPGPGGGGDRGYTTTNGGISSASAAASSTSSARAVSINSPPRPQSTAPARSGTSSTSATPARPQSTAPQGRGGPGSPTPVSTSGQSRYGGHARSASMIHRSPTVVPGVSSTTMSSASAAMSNTTSSATPGRDRERERRSLTPAPVHQRSASVAPGGFSSSASSAARGLTRSMTPNLSSVSRSSAATSGKDAPGNGFSAGGANYGAASEIPPVPAIPPHASHGVSGLSRPPVPPKPRTLSQSPQQNRGVIDDRDGYATEKESLSSKKGEKTEKKEGRYRHERWLPSAFVDRMTRPATSQG